METERNNTVHPFEKSLKRSFMPFQGYISTTFKLQNLENGNYYVHKVMDQEDMTVLYGRNLTLFEKASALTRSYKALNEIFDGSVAETQFIIAESRGKPTIEIIQLFIEGTMACDLPFFEKQDFRKYLDEKTGGTEKLADEISKRANISTLFAYLIATEVVGLDNWIKETNTNKIILVDF